MAKRKKKDIHRTTDGHYVVSFDGDDIHTTVADSGGAVDSWLDEIYRIHRHRLVVGLDIEWRPSYGGPEPPVALLQLCVDRRCLLFQILHSDYIPVSLFDFLADERFTFVGVGIDDDVAKLRIWYKLDVECAGDLRNAAADALGKPALRQAGLQALVRGVMGVQMDKPHKVRMSKWDARTLSYEQIKYACIDAFVSFEVDRRFCKCGSTY